MAKKITVNQPAPELGKPYAIIPMGMYLNTKIAKAQEGDIIEFQTEWRTDKRVFVRSCRVNIETSVFTFLLRSLLSGETSMKDLFKQWRSMCVMNGLGRNGFSVKEAYLVEIRDVAVSETELDRMDRYARRQEKIMLKEAKAKLREELMFRQSVVDKLNDKYHTSPDKGKAHYKSRKELNIANRERIKQANKEKREQRKRLKANSNSNSNTNDSTNANSPK